MPEINGEVDVVTKELELLHAPLDDLFGAEVTSPQKVCPKPDTVVHTETCGETELVSKMQARDGGCLVTRARFKDCDVVPIVYKHDRERYLDAIGLYPTQLMSPSLYVTLNKRLTAAYYHGRFAIMPTSETSFVFYALDTEFEYAHHHFEPLRFKKRGSDKLPLPCAQLLEHKFSLGYLRKAGSKALCLAYNRKVMERRKALHTEHDGLDPWVGPSSKPFDGVHI